MDLREVLIGLPSRGTSDGITSINIYNAVGCLRLPNSVGLETHTKPSNIKTQVGLKQYAKTLEQKNILVGLGTLSPENSGFPKMNDAQKVATCMYVYYSSNNTYGTRHIKQPGQAPSALSTPSAGRPLSHRHPPISSSRYHT